MPKLSDYVETAANEYLQETGKDALDAYWIARFFQDSGVQDTIRDRIWSRSPRWSRRR